MTTEKRLLGTNPVATGDTPEAVSFSIADSLTKTSMTGQADSKTFTFSCWIYPSSTISTNSVLYYLETDDRVDITYNNSNERIDFAMGITGEGNILTGHTGVGSVPKDTWSHFLMSCNMASSSQRHIYINDEIPPSLYWGTYNNFNVEFSVSGNLIAKLPYGSNAGAIRLSNLFLDYTYRALTTTANRRLFIDADGKPADGQADLTPILYLPMTDAATAGSNSGTGGDFTVNGVLATAERGPNQDNCSASVFDGSADYLNKGSLGATTTERYLTVSLNLMRGTAATYPIVLEGVPEEFLFITTDTYIAFQGYTASWSNLFYVLYFMDIPVGKEVHVSMSLDVLDVTKTKLEVNGVLVTPSTSTVDGTLLNIGTKTLSIGRYARANPTMQNMDAGEVYFDTAYTDLATDNPFWDSDTNRPNSVRKVIADTGVTPLIALPMIGSDAGNNLGSGGDFTVNSGPFTGARGGSEYWARSAYLDGTNANFSRAALSGVASTKTGTLALALNVKTIGTNQNVFSLESTSSPYFKFKVRIDGSTIKIFGYNTSGTEIFKVTTASKSSATWYTVLLSFDLANTSNRALYVNGASDATWNTYTNDTIAYAGSNITRIGNSYGDGGYSYYNGDVALCYFDDTYIDFTQESNRNKFVSQLDYPIDLTKQIDGGDIVEPLMYMKFDDTSALGTNSGTGGSFTATDPASGSDVTP